MFQVYNPPVGFARDPAPRSHSEGNEKYFAYVGSWKKGKMSGIGVYQYADGQQYEGLFENNWPSGTGSTRYANGGTYDGEWERGKYCGNGRWSSCGSEKDASVYTGEFAFGRRHGKGRLVMPCGLVYEGDFLDGKPHGRGVMTSTLTGYSFDGTFKRYTLHGL